MMRSTFRVIGLLVLQGILLGAGVLASGNGPASWVVPEEEAAMENPHPSTEESLARARKVYDSQCVMCHGPAGRGDGMVARTMGIHPADLTVRETVAGMTDGEIYYKITAGRDPMPSFRKKISDEERWLLAHLVRSFATAEAPGKAK